MLTSTGQERLSSAVSLSWRSSLPSAQRMQVANSISAVQAGIRILPLLFCAPVATAVSGVILSKLRLPPLYMLLVGCSLQAVGGGVDWMVANRGGLDYPTKPVCSAGRDGVWVRVQHGDVADDDAACGQARGYAYVVWRPVVNSQLTITPVYSCHHGGCHTNPSVGRDYWPGCLLSFVA